MSVDAADRDVGEEDDLGAVGRPFGPARDLEPLAQFAVEGAVDALARSAADGEPERLLAGERLGVPAGAAGELLPLVLLPRGLAPLHPDGDPVERPLADRAGVGRRQRPERLRDPGRPLRIRQTVPGAAEQPSEAFGAEAPTERAAGRVEDLRTERERLVRSRRTADAGPAT